MCTCAHMFTQPAVFANFDKVANLLASNMNIKHYKEHFFMSHKLVLDLLLIKTSISFYTIWLLSYILTRKTTECVQNTSL